MENLKEIETEKLLQMYANASVTCGCNGHYKGSQNERLTQEYAVELAERGISVPKDIDERLDKTFIINVEIPSGIFNGYGSF